MALVVRNNDPILSTVASVCNSIKKQIGSSVAHLDAAEYYTSGLALADASDLPTAIALANQLRLITIIHRADTLIHKAVDSTAPAAAATDATSVTTLLNGLKADHATHIASTSIHFAADASNVITASNATSGSTSSIVALANDIKAQYIGHYALAPTNSGSLIRLVSA